MIKPFVLEKLDAGGNSVVIGRYRSYFTALKRYNLLCKLKSIYGLKNYYNFIITVQPLVFVVYSVHITTKDVYAVDTFNSIHGAVRACNAYNYMSNGSVRYYVNCEIKED